MERRLGKDRSPCSRSSLAGLAFGYADMSRNTPSLHIQCLHRRELLLPGVQGSSGARRMRKRCAFPQRAKCECVMWEKNILDGASTTLNSSLWTWVWRWHWRRFLRCRSHQELRKSLPLRRQSWRVFGSCPSLPSTLSMILLLQKQRLFS